MMSKYCDIIIPVKNGLEHLRPCLESIIKYTHYPYKVILVDDASDNYIKDFLRFFSNRYTHIKLIENLQNLGFVKSCNKGLAISQADYVVLLNSDTIVTPNWLTKMVRCIESDSRIGIVNPLSNFAANLSIEIPSGDNIFTMAEKIERISKRLYPDIVTAVGFCFMITRNALNTLGGFDEIYQEGYCEESDYCMRAMSKGLRVVACDDTFIFHKGRASFKDYKQRYRNNRKIFDKKWKSAYEKAFCEFKKNNPLEYIKERIYTKRLGFSLWRAFKADIILLLRGIKNYGWRYAFKRFLYHLKERDSISFAKIKELNKKVENIKTESFNIKNRLKVTFILEELVICGGVNSIVEIVNELILQNLDAKIVACYRTDYIKDFTLYTQPIIFSDKKNLRRYFPHSDIIVATLWITAYDVKEILKRNPAVKAFYFIQDYEAWFYPEEDRRTRCRVKDTYELITNKIVKTQWLLNKLIKDGYHALKISPSINLDLFYPRNNGFVYRNKRIITMARPSTSWRGFQDAVKSLSLVKQYNADVEIIFFGTRDLSAYNISFPYTNAGIVIGNDLAQLYSSCDVYLDSSLFHGFGRMGLEAMACGCACVLTDSGGVSEYAQDNYNCLMVPVGDTAKMADAIIRLLEDEELRKRLVQNGLETAKRFTVQNAVSQLKEIFLSK